jgi:hypothetical protein
VAASFPSSPLGKLIDERRQAFLWCRTWRHKPAAAFRTGERITMGLPLSRSINTRTIGFHRGWALIAICRSRPRSGMAYKITHDRDTGSDKRLPGRRWGQRSGSRRPRHLGQRSVVLNGAAWLYTQPGDIHHLRCRQVTPT